MGYRADSLTLIIPAPLPIDWETISNMTLSSWKTLVEETTESMNKTELIDMCYSKNGEKTKTKLIISRLKSDDYVRQPLSNIFNKK